MHALWSLAAIAACVKSPATAQDVTRFLDCRDATPYSPAPQTATTNPLSTISASPFSEPAYPTTQLWRNSTVETPGTVALDILTKTGRRNATAPDLYGWMFEDINHSGDGGIYAELIQNRAFQGSSARLGSVPGIPGTAILESQNPTIPFGPTLDSWRPIGDVKMNLDIIHPLSEALPTVMQVDILEAATGEAGFLNEGWFGMDVSPQQYNASFYILSAPGNVAQPSSIDVSLRSNLTGEIWSTATILVTHNISDFRYTQFSAVINNNVTAPSSNNSFAITFNATQMQGTTFYFGLVSLFPETYKNRSNGLRKDIAEHVKALNPRFLRFPGGNNIEGYSPAQRWKWYNTVGPLIDRKGRVGNWDYFNTDGLGLLEFLQWCEDMDMDPVLAVYSGFSLDLRNYEGASFPQDDMQPVLQEALDMLEYCMGNVSTKYGAMRAKHGHTEPFRIPYVEIGNEDWFSETYPYRFPYLLDGLKSVYPDIKYISAAFNENANYNLSIPAGSLWDAHFYLEPPGFLQLFDYYDNWQKHTGNEGVEVFAGEYSVYNFSSNAPELVLYPRLISAVAESVYLLGLERNSEIVKLSSYAPSIRSADNPNQSPHLITYTADPKADVLSVSYYAQKMLNMYRGTQTLTVEKSQGDFDPLWWAASVDQSSGLVYLKVINSGGVTQNLYISLEDSFKNVNGTILTSGDPMDFNWFRNATAVVPKPLELTGPFQGHNLTWRVPTWSITVLQFEM